MVVARDANESGEESRLELIAGDCCGSRATATCKKRRLLISAIARETHANHIRRVV
jgi:hypothetical protein